MGDEGRDSSVGTAGGVCFPCFLANVVSVGQSNGLDLCCYHGNGSLLSGGAGEKGRGFWMPSCGTSSEPLCHHPTQPSG